MISWFLWALLAGAIAVNAGILLMARLVDRRRAGALIVALGVGVMGATLVLGGPLLTSDDPESSTDPRSDPPEIRTPVVDGLQVRRGPGADFEPAQSIWQVNEGDRLHVVEDSSGWIRFRLRYFDPAWSGWVNRRYTTSWDVYLEVRRIEEVRNSFTR